jgi:hypothetical protein
MSDYWKSGILLKGAENEETAKKWLTEQKNKVLQLMSPCL